MTVWRGAADTLTPASYTHHLVERLPRATERTVKGHGHLSIALAHATDILRSAADRSDAAKPEPRTRPLSR